ncbi:dimethyladenosine transferase [Thermoplasmatales archaeon SG8-52-1]|nr:MAG: dimethyladenosine transferase [Thermoplasmatales archaeon SG8-52-1]
MSQKLGQNFLIDNKVAEREIKYADITHNDIVLEIGPGKGILTKLLANSAKKVIAIEIDKSLIDRLKKILPDNVELIHGDCLKIDFKMLPKFNKIVSNLPFQISSPLTFKFLEHDFKLAVLIYQKEFADRMVAKAGSKDYSRLSVGIYYKTKCELLEIIPKTCFRPQPKVDSCIISLAPRKTPPFEVFDEIFFQDLTKILFNNRRKKIKNSLEKNYDISFDDISYLDKRIEDLTPEQIGELSNVLYKRINIKN